MAGNPRKAEISFIGGNGMMLRAQAHLVGEHESWDVLGVWRTGTEFALESLAQELAERYVRVTQHRWDDHGKHVDQLNRYEKEIAELKAEIAILKESVQQTYTVAIESYEDVLRDRDQLQREKQDVIGMLQALQLEIAKRLDDTKEK